MLRPILLPQPFWLKNTLVSCQSDGPLQSSSWLDSSRQRALENNPHANCLDFQIEADFAGIMAPGMVNSATEICDRVGHIMAYGDGWYGGVYVAAMYSLAYVSDDVEYVVTEALRSIPRESRFHACMADVINWHKQYPEDWKNVGKK